VSLTGGRYFRYEALPIDHAASSRLENVPSGSQNDVRVDSVLAEVLIEGPVMLWRVVRPGSTHYLVRRPKQPIVDLCERRYVRQDAAGRRVLVEGNNYSGQLKVYFGDCPAAVTAAASASFTAAGMAAVVQAYHAACVPTRPLMRSWVSQAAPRRRMALQGGIVAGVRYNQFSNRYKYLPQVQGCADCQPRPFAGLYAELFQPNRTRAVYGELSLSTFSNRNWAYFQTNSDVSYYVVDYQAWLASARLGLRFFFPLPHERQWLLSTSYELNKTIGTTIISSSGNLNAPGNDQLGYSLPSLLPNLGLGWRTQRLTLSLDGQLYTGTHADTFFSRLVGSDFVARFGVAYRLSSNPDSHQSSTATK
jgi:hypothetical protein